MSNNIHIVNAKKIAKLIPLAKTFHYQQVMVREWASEMRLACRLAKRG